MNPIYFLHESKVQSFVFKLYEEETSHTPLLANTMKSYVFFTK